MAKDLFDKYDALEIQAAAKVGIASVLEDSGMEGLDVSTSRLRHSQQTISMVVTVSVKVAVGDAKVPASFAVRAASLTYIFPADWRRRFVAGSWIYEVRDINLRSRKYPILANRVYDGRAFKFPDRPFEWIETAEQAAMRIAKEADPPPTPAPTPSLDDFDEPGEDGDLTSTFQPDWDEFSSIG